MKYAIVMQDKSGWWKVICRDTGKLIHGGCDNELEAYKTGNANGYLCS